MLSEKEQKRLENDFTYHPPKGTQADRYGEIRTKAKEFAELIFNHCPDSRERSAALTKIDEAVFFSNASIARNEND